MLSTARHIDDIEEIDSIRSVFQEKHIHRRFLQYIYEGSLTEKTMPNKSGKYVPQNDYGWTALAFDISGMSMRPANARSMPSLIKKIEKYGYQYYRPNLSYTSQSHKKRQLRWMVTLILDFDAEDLQLLGITSYNQLIKHVESFGYQVCGVVRTSSGFHVYLPMKQLRGQWNGDKSIQRYDHVLKNIVRKVGSDPGAATAEHYFRTPQESNVVYFNPVEKPHFDFYEQMIEDEGEKPFKTPSGNVNFGRMMSQAAMLKLLSGDFNHQVVVDTDKGRRKAGRNNAAFSIGLGMKRDGWTIEQALKEIELWYYHRINRYGLTLAEVKRAIKNAYKEEYKGPSALYIEAFTGIKFRPLTPRVPKDKRKYMQSSEIEERLITYLRRYYLEFDIDLTMSQAKLADALSVKLRSLQHVLMEMRKQGKLDIHTQREGRSNVSIYFLSAELLPAKDVNTEASLREQEQGGIAGNEEDDLAVRKASAEPSKNPRAIREIHSAKSCTYFRCYWSAFDLRSRVLISDTWSLFHGTRFIVLDMDDGGRGGAPPED